MADSNDVINTPIKTSEFSSDDLPEKEDEELIEPDEVDLEDDINIDDEEIDPIGGDALDDEGFDAELEDDSLFDEPEEPIAPEEQVRWSAVPQENGDIWSEHEDGFVLRARPLSAQRGNELKYAVQLFKDNKIIEKGVIWIDQDADAREYLENISDRILDRTGLVNFSNMEAKPAEPEPTLGPEELNHAVEDDLDTEAGSQGIPM